MVDSCSLPLAYEPQARSMVDLVHAPSLFIHSMVHRVHRQSSGRLCTARLADGDDRPAVLSCGPMRLPRGSYF